MSSARVFLAVPLPPQIKASICAAQRNLQTQIPGVRWVRPENLHLTLHFFGETTQESLEKIKVSVLSVKHCQRPFMVEIKGLGAFPNRHRPRVLWFDLEPKGPLRQLHRDCQKFLRQAGVVSESRSYSPHLTIGRLRQSETDLTDICRSVGQRLVGQLPVDRLVLFESRLHSDGAEHIPLLTVTFDDKTSNM